MRWRVLQVHNYSNWGGNLEHLHTLLRGLVGKRFHLFLAAPPNEAYVERFRDLDVTLVPFEARSYRDLRAVRQLASLIRKWKIDLVHSHLRRTDWICACTRPLCPGRVWVTTVHGEVNLGPDFKRQDSLKNRLYGRVLARAFHRVLTVSRDLAEHLATEEGVKPARLTALVNGVEITTSTPSTPESRRARAAGNPAYSGTGVPCDSNSRQSASR